MVELVDQLREGTYCPLSLDKRVDKEGAEAERVCSALSGG